MLGNEQLMTIKNSSEYGNRRIIGTTLP